MNYNIILDEKELTKFIDTILVDTKVDEQYYLSLLARNKWNPLPTWKGDQAQLKRVTSTKNRMVEKIRQMECALGTYKNNENPIPNENLGLYIMPNPRSFKKAQINMLKEIANNIGNNLFIENPQAMALTQIQKSCGSKPYFDLDVDIDKTVTDKYQILKEIYRVLCKHFKVFSNHTIVTIDTHGGFHILLRLIDADKFWHPAIKEIKIDGLNIEMNGDNLLPLPGCTQGGRMPFMVNMKEI